MIIGELDQHCGECGVIDFCGKPFCYCLCTDERFSDMDEDDYAKMADHAKTTPFLDCAGCETDDCESCDIDDEKNDNVCRQIADYVSSVMTT